MFGPPATGGYAPTPSYRYLLPHERHVLTVHFHPAMLIRPTGIVLVGFMAAGLVPTLKISADDQITIWATFGIVLVYGFKKFIDWSFGYYVVTSNRMLVIRGVFNRDVEMLPLTAAVTLKYRRTFWGYVFGYGRFIVEGVGQDPALRVINYIPYPDQIYEEVCSQIFPEGVAPAS
jgi:hypothetical protein